ncbi:MAG TPA: hypothetical protein VMS22_16810 [Candidatus Eisenbacteria bacterium]|nr:hypothetical protein [Candidatus Eisenbacteria bacterium]
MTQVLRLVCFVLIASACARSPYTGRMQSMGVDESEAMELADRAAEQYRRRIKPVADPAVTERANRVATRLVAAAKNGPAGERAARLPWEVVVAEGVDTNVAVLENGKIFVGAALLRVARTDAELAGPLGNAVAQVILRHPSERAKPRIIPQMLAMTETSEPEGPSPLETEQENEADYVGLLLAAEAGYDPDQVLPIYDRLGESARADRLRKRLPELRDTLSAASG